jgi:hypothetical protein
LSERLGWMFFRITTAGRIIRSARLFSNGASGRSRNVNRLSQCRSRCFARRSALRQAQGGPSLSRAASASPYVPRARSISRRSIR